MIEIAEIAGFRYSQIIEFTITELLRIINAYNKRIEIQRKEKLFILYNQSILNSVATNNPKSFPKTLYNAFPEVFEKEIKEKTVADIKKLFSKRGLDNGN